MTATPTAQEPLQRTLAAEHAAVWTYGLLGGRTSQSAEPALYAAIDDAHRTHRDRRDELAALLRELGAEPVASAPTYDAPRPGGRPLDTAPRVTRAALDVERACGETYAAMVAETVGGQRRWAVEALADAAGRELDFGGRPRDFPGAPELETG